MMVQQSCTMTLDQCQRSLHEKIFFLWKHNSVMYIEENWEEVSISVLPPTPSPFPNKHGRHKNENQVRCEASMVAMAQGQYRKKFPPRPYTPLPNLDYCPNRQTV